MNGGDALDVVVVGGGPGGLSAAFWLARYRRSVRVYDTGEPRNEPTWAVHGYPGLPDTPPMELRRRMREQAIGAGAEVRAGSVSEIAGEKDRFEVRLSDGTVARARRIVLAYGRQDLVPAVPGIDGFYGTSVFHCPDCDGPSFVGGRVGVIGWDRPAAALALYLKTWAAGVWLLAHGHPLELDDDQQRTLETNRVPILPAAIAALEPEAERLRAVRLADGGRLPMDGLFFHLGTVAGASLAERIGCELDNDGYIRVERAGQTTVPGVYAAGDITGHPHLVVSAAAEGVTAALSIHRSLLPAEWRL